VSASKLNDDRLGRALDAIYPHLEEIWAEIVSQALVRYRIDLSLVFYDLTAFYFEGEYKDSSCVTFRLHSPSQGQEATEVGPQRDRQREVPLPVPTAGRQRG